MSNQRTANVIAHRGASADHRENTVAAFHGARDQGADWVELDVRTSADGVLVVHHDSHYSDGRTVATTAAQDRPDHVPDLVEALDACAGMGVNIEIKNSPGDLGPGVERDLVIARRVVDLVRQRAHTHPEQPLLITSFDESTLVEVRSADDGVDVGLLAFDGGTIVDALARSVAVGLVAVHPWDGIVDVELMAHCSTTDLQVNTWTVDDPDRMRHLVGLGVHGIITNRPGLAADVLSR